MKYKLNKTLWVDLGVGGGGEEDSGGGKSNLQEDPENNPAGNVSGGG